MSLRYFLAALLLMFALSSKSWADSPSELLRLQCDKYGSVVRINYLDFSLSRATDLLVKSNDKHVDCVLDDGTEIRVKFGAIYCCDPHTSAWVSVWINRQKILSRRSVWFSYGVNLRDISITANAVEVCNFLPKKTGDTENWPDWYAKELPQDFPYACNEIHRVRADTEVDAEEYPQKGALKPRVGSFVLRKSEVSSICSGIDPLNLPKSTVVWERASNARNESRAKFDFEGTGSNQEVARKEAAARAYSGTYFVVAPLGTEIPSGWMIDSNQSSETSLKIYVGSNGQSWEVVSIGGQQFLLGTEMVGFRGFDPALVVGVPRNGQIHTICEFEKVRENY